MPEKEDIRMRLSILVLPVIREDLPNRDLSIRSTGEVEMTAVEFAGLSDLEWVRSYQH